MPSVGTTVNINSVGKSTLAKALCHNNYLRLQNYFIDGFWCIIRLGLLPVSPAIKLGQLLLSSAN